MVKPDLDPDVKNVALKILTSQNSDSRKHDLIKAVTTYDPTIVSTRAFGCVIDNALNGDHTSTVQQVLCAMHAFDVVGSKTTPGLFRIVGDYRLRPITDEVFEKLTQLTTILNAKSVMVVRRMRVGFMEEKDCRVMWIDIFRRLMSVESGFGAYNVVEI